MANKIYPKYKQAILSGGSSVDMSGGTVKVALVDSGTYTYADAHEFLSSLSGRVGTDQTLTSKTFTDGVFAAGNATFSNVSGASVEALVIYIDTGTAGTSRLVAYLDDFTAVTPNGGNITITWSGSGIFAL